MRPDTRHPPAPTRQDFRRALERGADGWYAACRRITRDDALAEDAVQDALLSAWCRREQFRGGARLESWIHRIAINSALTLLRQRRPWDAASASATATAAECGGAADTLLQARAAQEVGRDLEAALAALSDLERVCFLLRHLEQWRLAEIAGRLDTGVGSVKQALFRALGKLRVSPVRLRRHGHDR